MTLLKELGLQGNGNCSSETYVNVNNNSSENIINNHSKYLKKSFNLSLDLKDKCLPTIYWLPKLHKKPTKARFIIAAPKCSLKLMSKAITKVFKLMYNQIEDYNKKCHFFTGVKTFWTIQNNSPVIKSINNLNKRNKALQITSFDFSTLYTKIPHDKLLKVLNELIDFCFKGGTKDFIAVDKYGAKWVNDVTSYSLVFSKASLKKSVKYLMNNCFFQFGNKIFRQVIGITMGSDPAPFMANLFLYYYENKWVLKTKKKNLRHARMFGNTFRFIDDLIAINDGGLFEMNFGDIYPKELELKKENVGTKESSFLDLSIKISQNKFEGNLFDKRDAFSFSIVRMPILESNVPTNIFYSSLGAELLRIGRANNKHGTLFNSAHTLVKTNDKSRWENK